MSVYKFAFCFILTSNSPSGVGAGAVLRPFFSTAGWVTFTSSKENVAFSLWYERAPVLPKKKNKQTNSQTNKNKTGMSLKWKNAKFTKIKQKKVYSFQTTLSFKKCIV